MNLRELVRRERRHEIKKNSPATVSYLQTSNDALRRILGTHMQEDTFLLFSCAHFIRFLKLVMVYGVKWQFVKMLQSNGTITGCLRVTIFWGKE